MNNTRPRTIGQRKTSDKRMDLFHSIMKGTYRDVMPNSLMSELEEQIDELDIISAMDIVYEESKNLGASPENWSDAYLACEFLCKMLGLTTTQVIIITMLVNEGAAMSWQMLAKHLGVSRLKMMTYTDEIEELTKKKRWLYRKAVQDFGRGNYEGFALVPGVVTALRHNEVFVPEKLSEMSEQSFFDHVASVFTRALSDRNTIFADCEEWLMNLVDENPQLPICREIQSMNGDIHDKSLYLYVITDYTKLAGLANEGLTIRDIDRLYPEDWECDYIRARIEEGSHELFSRGLVEHKCEDGMADNTTIVLTSKSKNEMLSAYKLHFKQPKMKSDDRCIVKASSIEEKQLYYNANEGSQVERLSNMLSKERFAEIQARLSDKGLRTGVAVLMSGGPGTGKTETVRQLARATGRDIFMVDISAIKSKWVGESEENTKAIFDRYNAACKNSEHKPILFINECDAILGKRFENVEHSADKMQNAMQNILLQSLEDLQGIMICTTNLASTLDNAFERRFLMKIEFQKPEAAVRSKIWKTMIPQLSDDDAKVLGERYCFSGGQCENVMRKVAIDEILNGVTPSIDSIDAFCTEENFVKKSIVSPISGFSMQRAC